MGKGRLLTTNSLAARCAVNCNVSNPLPNLRAPSFAGDNSCFWAVLPHDSHPSFEKQSEVVVCHPHWLFCRPIPFHYFLFIFLSFFGRPDTEQTEGSLEACRNDRPTALPPSFSRVSQSAAAGTAAQAGGELVILRRSPEKLCTVAT